MIALVRHLLDNTFVQSALCFLVAGTLLLVSAARRSAGRKSGRS